MEILEISRRPELFEKALQVFWGEWGSHENRAFYEDCMKHSCNHESDLPRFYIGLQNDEIIGTYALLRNDINSRQDLHPWLACLYVDPAYRGKELGRELLEHGLREAAEKGYKTLYLTTDIDGYYEKYGWIHSGEAYGPGGGSIKVYAKEAVKENSSADKRGSLRSKIRPFTEQDLPIILAHSSQAISDGTLGEARPSDEKAGRLVQSLLDKECRYLVAEDGDAFQGWVLIGGGKDSLTGKTYGFIYELYVLEPFRGNGLGRKLMEEAMNQLKLEGHKEVRLSVFAGNQAIQLYEKMGFTNRTLSMTCSLIGNSQ